MQQSPFMPEEYYYQAADAVRQRTTQSPTIGIVLGSGLGTLIEEIQNPDVIPYAEITRWPVSTVHGHAGQLVIGQMENHTVLAMQGRAHFYEGYSVEQVTLPIRVMKLLGIHTVILTNAAGGLNPEFNAGDIMVIRDHINLVAMSGHSPLRGPNLDTFGPRFSIHTRTYDLELSDLAHQVAEANGFSLREGVYVYLAGPAFETPAEVRMLRSWGGDAVGMSTAHEALVAYHAGMRVVGFSSITNMSLDTNEAREEVSHEEVLRLGREIVPRLATVIRGVLYHMPPFKPEMHENWQQ